jgi:hypothetical protein
MPLELPLRYTQHPWESCRRYNRAFTRSESPDYPPVRIEPSGVSPNPRPKAGEQENFGEFAGGYAARKLPKPLLVKAVGGITQSIAAGAAWVII